MAFPQDEQKPATVNSATDQTTVAGTFAADAPHGDTSNTTPAAVTFVSGTAKVVNSTADTMLYINITTSAALAIAMGPTNSVANTISVSQSSALGVITVRVPKGWYVKLTGTMADVTCLQVPVQ